MNNDLLIHMLDTISYRFKKIIKYTNPEFGSFKIYDDTRNPNEILNHINDVLFKTNEFIETEKYINSTLKMLQFDKEVERFYQYIKELEKTLTKEKLDIEYSKKLIQGPFSDVLSHIGQLSMLCGMSGNKIPGENFSSAKI